MEIAKILESLMLLCWGASWPFQVYKTYKTKDVKGKSILFLWLVEMGYIIGLFYKYIYHYDGVVYLYWLNFILIAMDIALYYKYAAAKTKLK